MKVSKSFRVACCLALVALGAPARADTPAVTEHVLAAGDGPQERVRVSPDGSDGFYAAWVDGTSSVRVQRLTSNAAPIWAAPRSITAPAVAALHVVGTKNGAFVVWSDGGTSYVQFVQPNGSAKWTTPTRIAEFAVFRAVSDGKDRVALLGKTVTNSHVLHIIDGAGALSGGHTVGSLFTDSSGGPTDIHPVDVVAVAPGQLVVAWGGPTLHVKKVGDTNWGPAQVVTNFGNKSPVRVAADGSGGAVIFWGDRRRAPREADLYARRVNATGALQGSAGGVELHRNIRPELEVVSDGAGGAIAAFTAESSQGSFVVPRVFAQRVTSAGVKAWAASIRLDASTDSSRLPVITADGSGGAFILQKTEPTATGARMVDCLVAQRVAANGALGFGASGLRVGRCDAFPPQAVVAAGKDLVLAGWRDTRNGYPDAYLWSAPAAGARAPAVAAGPSAAPAGPLPTIKLAPKLPKQPGKPMPLVK